VANGFSLTAVALPDGKDGTRIPGATLVVIYRISTAPPKAIVFYDGGYTMAPTGKLSQTILGFYEASKTDPHARMTQIAGNGSSTTTEHLTVNGSLPAGVSATSPFNAALGADWDSPTFDVSSLIHPNGNSVTTLVTPSSAHTCLSFAAIVMSTTVQDTDNDGLPDVWETNTGLTDPHGNPLPPLSAMGANPNVRDIFIEIDYMTTPGWTTALAGTDPAHSHLPSHAVLDTVCSAFKAQGINLHLDVGNNYQTAPPDPCIIPSAYSGGEGGGQALDVDFHHCRSERHGNHHDWRCE
jgi:hypothetical protein